MIRTRKNVLKLPASDKTLLWYGKAIASMQKKLIADPASWRYQAAVHEYTRSEDPHASAGDKLPSKADQKKFWTQCQHGSWYFLPWHRMYLHFFEQMILAELKLLGGPSGWALPYWNYSASASAALLPAAFRNSSLPDGSPNPLYVAQRDPDANAGNPFAPPVDTAITYCLMRTKFPGGNTGGSAGFGGPLTKFEHGGATQGSMENIPHGSMHVAVGGSTGWMSAFTTAPLDPIFWLHHCNLDRLWEVWLQRDPAHSDPTTTNWLTSVSFPFHDAAGNIVAMTPSQVLQIKTAPLSYKYDDTSDPLAPAAAAIKPAAAVAKTPKGKAMAAQPAPAGQPVPEMIGATAASFQLDKSVTEQTIKLQKPTGPAAEPTDKPRRVFLHVEGITSNQRSAPYDVYLNLPAGAAPGEHPELHAGRMSMFGLVEASRSGRNHPDNGLHYTLEITALYEKLSAAPGWNPRSLRVAFVPGRPNAPAGAKVARLSVYMQ